MSPRVRAARPALLALAAVLALLTAAAAPGATAAGAASAQTAPSDELEPEQTVIHVQLHGDGDATVTVSTRLAVSSDADRAAFDELAARFESGEMRAPWLDRLEVANDAADEATDRPMELTDVDRTSDAENGTVGVQARWTNFSREEDEYLVTRDAFNTTDGTWLPGLARDQVLVLELPENPVVRNSPKAVQDGRLRWVGPHEFEPGHPYVEFRASSTATTDPGDDERGLLFAGFFVVGLGVVVVGGYVLTRRRTWASRGGPTGPSGGPAAAGDPSPPDGGGAGAQTATTGTVEPAPDPEPEPVDEELLSDEERVERLLERNGGRMKQANIVKETGWSNAKVSQLLSSMADEGRVDKLRIGRENLISFPDEDVTDVDE